MAKQNNKKYQEQEEAVPLPELHPSSSSSDDDSNDDDNNSSVYDSEDGLHYNDDNDNDSDSENDIGSENDDDDDEFEDQGSSDEDEELLERQMKEDDSGDDDDNDDDIALSYENQGPRNWNHLPTSNSNNKKKKRDDDQNAEGGHSNQKLSTSSGGDGNNNNNQEEIETETAQEWMHADDLSSDDDDDANNNEKLNRIGRVPLHWYDEYDHIGYDVRGTKLIKSKDGTSDDRLDQAIKMQDDIANGKFVVRDTLNDRDVELSARQLELIRRVQSGAYAHPEHDAYPDYVDYYSGVDPQISGINSNVQPPKSRFQPSKWEQLQVNRLLQRLENGHINMDYLTGKIKDMNDVNKETKDDPNKPFLLWKGDEEDELNARKGPQHIPPPKLPPPGHALSYVPPDEYIPTDEDLEKWGKMEPNERPYGKLFIPRKFNNLRSVGSYQHSVQETFERCLDLYLCPRLMKRKLNINPESLVPSLPRASDLRPFPTCKCIEYNTPYDNENNNENPPIIRCITASPDGQFMVSGASDGHIRLWEVSTGRLLRSWDLMKIIAENNNVNNNNENNPTSTTEGSSSADGGGGNNEDEGNNAPANNIKPVVSVQWNPNRSHHCLLAAIGNYVVIVATGTAGRNDAEVTEALLASASRGGSNNVAATSNNRARKAVKWIELENVDGDEQQKRPVSAFDRTVGGPVCALRTSREVASVKWQAKGDYFVTVSPKAGAAAVLIHQLSKGHSQQPFGKSKGESQLACFHPTKPFLFVASQQHVRIYHLVKQSMVKRLVTGCRWISSIDIHPTGDHLIVGTLDRRMVWFDLDLGATPYKTLKYHERAIRSCAYHGRYPLMASGSDDGSVHVFHGMVYNDLMRNPLIVPVKILKGHHTVTSKSKLGVLAIVFHPTQPWIFTAGADGKIILYQDI